MPKREPAKVTPETVRQLSAYTGVGADESELANIVADLQGVYDALESVGPDRLRNVEPMYVSPLQREKSM
jgi:hypothetical protein